MGEKRDASLEFEKPLAGLEKRLEELRHSPEHNEHAIADLEEQLEDARRDLYLRLDAWQKTQVARHPERPYTLDFVHHLVRDFVEVHGDRKFADDPAVVAGFGFFADRPVAIVGHQKGRDTREKVRRNFGMPRPEGYRKALRVMSLAAKFKRPILTFIDTPGAYPGIGAEERGQAEAIAFNLKAMSALEVPIVVSVTGEGGSGGALAIGVGDTVLMLEHATYSVISPEACSSILYRSADRAPETAAALKLTAQDLLGFGIVDRIVAEPPGGAHRDPATAAALLGTAIERSLEELVGVDDKERGRRRYERFRRIGAFAEGPGGGEARR